MSSLVAALDTHTPTCIGENGHLQHGWSNDLKEKILQFSFQLTRCDKSVVRSTLAVKFREILSQIPISASADGHHLLTLIMQMIAHTRDIVNGKGEYELSYMMIYELYVFFPELSQCLLRHLVRFDTDDSAHPYGSWKDIKYFCNYVDEQNRCSGRCSTTPNHPLISYAHNIALTQLRNDVDCVGNSISLVARWLPREKSKKFGWQFRLLAEKYYAEWVETAKCLDRLRLARAYRVQRLAHKKCYTHFRKLLSQLNVRLDTVQIKQAANTWGDIDHANVTSITMRKQNKAFRNVKANTSEERVCSDDRRKCAANFNEFMHKASTGEATVKGKRVSIIDFVKDAISAQDAGDRQVLNMQWRDNSTQTGALPNMIPMIDTSGSMTCDNNVPLYSAVGLGIRIAEKSKLTNRAITFSSTPSWIRYDGCNEFTDKVAATMRGEWGFSTNFTAALKLILSAIEEARLPADEVNDMVLVVLSDMQINANGNEPLDSSMYAHIERLYAEAGIRVHGSPYKPPGILFWNLRSTSGFPTFSAQKNAFMMSGSSPALLNMFCEKGIEALRQSTPWATFVEMVTHTRYSHIRDFTEYFIAECSV